MPHPCKFRKPLWRDRHPSDVAISQLLQPPGLQSRIATECMMIQDVERTCVRRFMESLDDVLDITARQLRDRFDFQKTRSCRSLPCLASRLWNGPLKPDVGASLPRLNGTRGCPLTMSPPCNPTGGLVEENFNGATTGPRPASPYKQTKQHIACVT